MQSFEHPLRTGWRRAIVRASAMLLLVCLGCEYRASTEGPAPEPEAVAQIRQAMLSATAGDGGGAKQATGTGWATLTGSFKLAPGAAIPARKRKNVDKERDVCAPGGVAPLGQELVVDESSRGIANVLIFLRKASRVNDSVKPKEEQVVFDQKECIFLTHVAPMQLGQTLLIKNSDPAPVTHNTNISETGMRGESTNKIVPPGESVTFTPTAAESKPVAVACSIHPWMKAYLFPHDNGYMAVTKPDGTFTIPDLPAGEELEMQVWHESAASPSGALVLEQPELKWSSRGRFKIKLEEGKDKKLDLVVPLSAFKI